MWSLGVLLYIMLSGRHPFERPASARKAKPGEDDGTAAMMSNILAANYSFDSAQWNGISGRARKLVTQLLEPDPDKRLTAAQLLAHSWVRGEDVPERPLPETVERLRAFKTASTAIHGSLLMAALLHQEGVREQLQAGKLRKPSSGWMPGKDKGQLLRRTTTEGVGMLQPREDFNVVRAAWKLFDPEDKGHILAEDLYRVCNQLGYAVSERDVENMLSVLAPTENTGSENGGKGGKASGGSNGSGGGASDGGKGSGGVLARQISYDKFAKMMESSYRRRFAPGEHVFSQGDAVDGFYIVVSGECKVTATPRAGQSPTEIAKLGPGDCFGETGLLEGRTVRNSSVVCETPVEVLMIDNAMFLHLTEMQAEGSTGAVISGRMRERAEARQRSRLNKAIEMMQAAPLQQMRYKTGDVLFRQGDPASHFYIVRGGRLQITFVSSNGEEAELGQLSPGDQFGYDAVVGEFHDTTVRCLEPAEVVMVPRESLQKAFTQDTYLQSVWQAPAQRSIKLRRQKSQALSKDFGEGGSTLGKVGGAASSSVEGELGSYGEMPPLKKYASGYGDMRLANEEFAPLIRRARMCSLTQGEAAFEQGSVPTGVYLIRKGKCHVEHTSKEGVTEIVGELSGGDHFGEEALLEGREKRNSTVRGVDPDGCGIGVLGKGAFEAMMQTQPELATAFEQALQKRNQQRLRSVIKLRAERAECETRHLQAGEVLFTQGAPADAFFLVDKGAVQMSYRTADGRQLPVRTHRAGDIFGASGLVVGHSTRRDTAVALEPTTLKLFPHSQFHSLVRQDSLIAEGLRRAASAKGLEGSSTARVQ